MKNELQYIDDLTAGKLRNLSVTPATSWDNFRSGKLKPAQKKIRFKKIGKFIAFSGLVALISSLFFFQNNTEQIKAQALSFKSKQNITLKSVKPPKPDIKPTKKTVNHKQVIVHKKIYIKKKIQK